MSDDEEMRAVMGMAEKIDDLFVGQPVDYCAAALSLQIVKVALALGHVTPEAISKWCAEELAPHVRSCSLGNQAMLNEAAKVMATNNDDTIPKKGLRVVPST